MFGIKSALLGMSAVLALASCAAGPEVNSSVAMAVPEGDGKISVLFQDFPSGTVCSVATPEGLLTADQMPGKIDFPSKYRTSPISCATTQGARYSVDVNSSLPATFRVAGITVRPDGSLFATISTGEALIRGEKADAVKRTQ